MHIATSARKIVVRQVPLQGFGVNASLTVLFELLTASDMTVEEGFCAFAFGESDGVFDPKHRMEFKQFHAVAVGHLSSRLSESAIVELFHSGLDLNGDGCVDGEEWVCALHFKHESLPHVDDPSFSNGASMQRPLPSFRQQRNSDAAHALQDNALMFPSNDDLSQIPSETQENNVFSIERHRLTPMWSEDWQHTREIVQTYLDVSLLALCGAAQFNSFLARVCVARTSISFRRMVVSLRHLLHFAIAILSCLRKRACRCSCFPNSSASGFLRVPLMPPFTT
jgi:hypothetical protein